MIFDGKLVREESLKELKKKFEKIKCGLAVIQVGDDFASNKYIAQKEKLANELGVNFKLIKLEKDLRSLYDKVNDVVKDFSEYKKPYKSKNAKDNLEVEEDPFDNSPSVLDFVNQKVLNVFLILLSIIFIVMCIAFVWFIIFVSTF